MQQHPFLAGTSFIIWSVALLSLTFLTFLSKGTLISIQRISFTTFSSSSAASLIGNIVSSISFFSPTYIFVSFFFNLSALKRFVIVTYFGEYLYFGTISVSLIRLPVQALLLPDTVIFSLSTSSSRNHSSNIGLSSTIISSLTSRASIQSFFSSSFSCLCALFMSSV